MKIVLQRVSQASVSVENQEISKIERGYLLLVGVGSEDNEHSGSKIAKKISELRLFPNDEGKFDKSINEVGGDILAVSQFTLYGKTDKGRRPDFTAAMEPKKAREIFDQFVQELREHCKGRVLTGQFGAMMDVELCNDGPVTIVL